MNSQFSDIYNQAVPQSSKVLQYFHRNLKNKEAVCKLCQMRVNIPKFDLSVLTLHLKHYHPNQLNKINQEDDNLGGFGGIYEVGNFSNYNNQISQWKSQYSYNIADFEDAQFGNTANFYNNQLNFDPYFDQPQNNYTYDVNDQKQPSQISLSSFKESVWQKPDINKNKNINSEKKKDRYYDSYDTLSSKMVKVKQKSKIVNQFSNINQDAYLYSENDQINHYFSSTTNQPKTYPKYSNIKNRPTIFLQKITNQGYLDDDVLQGQIPIKDNKISTVTKQFFSNIDLTLNKQATVELAKQKLKINAAEAQQLIEKLWWGNKKISQICTIFQYRGINFKQQATTNSYLICEKAVLSDYLRFGESIQVISYENLIKMSEQINSQDQFCDAYIFQCSDWRSESVFLAVGIGKNKSSVSVLSILQMFYGCMNGFISNTISICCIEGNSYEYFAEGGNKFCKKYECKIVIDHNILANEQKYHEQMRKWKESQLVKMKMYNEIQHEIQKFEDQITQIIQEEKSQQNAQLYEEIMANINQVLQVKVSVSQGNVCCFEKYNPLQSTQIQSFIGLVSSVSQCEELHRKMSTVVKSTEERPLMLNDFISRCFKLCKLLKKISKQPALDFRCDYRKYKHSIIYKLYKKLGIKVFNILQRNYLDALKLIVKEIHPLSVEILQSKTKIGNHFSYNNTIFTLKFQLNKYCWVCNCNRIYETGIPCRHIIAVVLKYGGDLEYYVNERWIPTKMDKEKIKKLRQKLPTDRDL